MGIESEYAQFPKDKCLISDKIAPIPPVKTKIEICSHFKSSIQYIFLNITVKPK